MKGALRWCSRCARSVLGLSTPFAEAMVISLLEPVLVQPSMLIANAAASFARPSSLLSGPARAIANRSCVMAGNLPRQFRRTGVPRLRATEVAATYNPWLLTRYSLSIYNRQLRPVDANCAMFSPCEIFGRNCRSLFLRLRRWRMLRTRLFGELLLRRGRRT